MPRERIRLKQISTQHNNSEKLKFANLMPYAAQMQIRGIMWDVLPKHDSNRAKKEDSLWGFSYPL